MIVSVAVTDTSFLGKMRGTYPITHATFHHYLGCYEAGKVHFLLYLVLRALPEEVLRSSNFTRNDCVPKAILSCKIFMTPLPVKSDSAPVRRRKPSQSQMTLTGRDGNNRPHSIHCGSVENFFQLAPRESFGDHTHTAKRVVSRSLPKSRMSMAFSSLIGMAIRQVAY
jgi:hypothetical protein